MIKIAPSSSFQRAFKKRIKGNPIKENAFYKNIDLFIDDPFNPKLKTHKLTGKFKDLWSFSIDYDLRIIFFFEKNQSKAVFVDFGKHDEVY